VTGVQTCALPISAAFSPAPIIPNRIFKMFLHLRTRIHDDVKENSPAMPAWYGRSAALALLPDILLPN
jgi:hypothetical protein